MRVTKVGEMTDLSYTHLIRHTIQPKSSNFPQGILLSPSQPERCHSIPAIGNGADIGPNLNVPQENIVDQLPVLLAILIVAGKAQASAVVDALR